MGVLKYRDPDTGEWVATGGAATPGVSAIHADQHALGGPDPVTPEMIGAMQMDLLWENASPASDFVAQTISLDLSGYDMVAIEHDYQTENRRAKITFASVYKSSTSSNTTDLLNTVVDSGVTGLYTRFRTAGVNNVCVTFGDGYLVNITTTSTAAQKSDDCCCPTKIYGVKGVSAI